MSAPSNNNNSNSAFSAPAASPPSSSDQQRSELMVSATVLTAHLTRADTSDGVAVEPMSIVSRRSGGVPTAAAIARTTKRASKSKAAVVLAAPAIDSSAATRATAVDAPLLRTAIRVFARITMAPDREDSDDVEDGVVPVPAAALGIDGTGSAAAARPGTLTSATPRPRASSSSGKRAVAHAFLSDENDSDEDTSESREPARDVQSPTASKRVTIQAATPSIPTLQPAEGESGFTILAPSTTRDDLPPRAGKSAPKRTVVPAAILLVDDESGTDSGALLTTTINAQPPASGKRVAKRSSSPGPRAKSNRSEKKRLTAAKSATTSTRTTTDVASDRNPAPSSPPGFNLDELMSSFVSTAAMPNALEILPTPPVDHGAAHELRALKEQMAQLSARLIASSSRVLSLTNAASVQHQAT